MAQRIRARAVKKIAIPVVLCMENNRLARAISASSAPPSTSCATFEAIQPSAMLDRISNAISQWNVFVTLP
jgi:hypothetical protein